MAADENGRFTDEDGRFSGSSSQESSSSSSDSESGQESGFSGCDTDGSTWEYGRPVTVAMFRMDGLPSDETLRKMFALTKDDTWMTSRLLQLDGTKAREILCRADFQIRGRIIKTHANSGTGATRSCAYTGPYLAQSLLTAIQL